MQRRLHTHTEVLARRDARAAKLHADATRARLAIRQQALQTAADAVEHARQHYADARKKFDEAASAYHSATAAELLVVAGEHPFKIEQESGPPASNKAESDPRARR